MPLRALISIEFASIGVFQGGGLTAAVTAMGFDNTSNLNSPNVAITTASGLTQNTIYRILNNNNSGGYIGMSGEL